MKERILSDLAKVGSGKASDGFVKELCRPNLIDPRGSRLACTRPPGDHAPSLRGDGGDDLGQFHQPARQEFRPRLGPDQDYRIELDQDRIVDEAVETSWTASAPGEEKLTELLKGFARFQVEEEKDSRIRHPLTSYGKEVLKEGMREALQALDELKPEDFSALSRDIRKDVKREERELSTRAEAALEAVRREGLTKKDVSRGSLISWLEKNRRGEAVAPTPTLEGMFDEGVFTTQRPPPQRSRPSRASRRMRNTFWSKSSTWCREPREEKPTF